MYAEPEMYQDATNTGTTPNLFGVKLSDINSQFVSFALYELLSTTPGMLYELLSTYNFAPIFVA